MHIRVPLQMVVALGVALIASPPARAMGAAAVHRPVVSENVVPAYYCGGYNGSCCGNGYRRYRSNYGYGGYRGYGGYGGGYRGYRNYDRYRDYGYGGGRYRDYNDRRYYGGRYYDRDY